ncbi:DNA-directed RNA polymerase III subunit rpc8-like [Punica granatum]|uniref:DNA-directed RNA polymerase subunit n=1 Tax=Punica granatum TaxID=22663 RepID=A0A6P8EB64_PUNGR|nr:DNA-directed RNA polymerase III subunit rpc8-like [Punica granatum]
MAVRCRLIMFRPFVGETIDAKLKDYDENSLRLSLGFFDDICVPSHLLLFPSHYQPDPENGNRRRWVWEYQADAENQTSGSTFTSDEISANVRFKVQSISYPSIPLEQPNNSKPFTPMVITGSLDNDGLGPISWWE